MVVREAEEIQAASLQKGPQLIRIFHADRSERRTSGCSERQDQQRNHEPSGYRSEVLSRNSRSVSRLWARATRSKPPGQRRRPEKWPRLQGSCEIRVYTIW